MIITAIIVNYYTSSFINPLLEILCGENPITTIVIADNSNEKELKVLEGIDRRIQYLPFTENIGFGAAVNFAARKYVADYYLTINPDTLPDKGFLNKLIEGSETYKALITGPRFFMDTNKIYRMSPALGQSLWIWNGMNLSNQSKSDSEVLSAYWNMRFKSYWEANEPFMETFLSGGCLLIRNDSSFFNNQEIFDERFFMYYEDTDLCMRALLVDKPMICIPDAEVVHYWNQSPSKNKGKYMSDSHTKFMEKYYENFRSINNTVIPSDIQTNSSAAKKVIELGELETPPVFDFNFVPGNGKLYFEFALSTFFVPFVQTDVTGSPFTIPVDIWQRLDSGQYYGRIKNTINQTLITWKWKKR